MPRLLRRRIDLSVRVGDVALRVPIMTAAGTSGHGAELHDYFDLSQLGAVVVKSLSAFAWAGNCSPRVTGTNAGMLNAVGLANPGVQTWLRDDLPRLTASGATVVASVWGRTVAEFAAAAALLAQAPPGAVSAVEANISCPNTEAAGDMFAHCPTATAAAVRAVVDAVEVPVWAKLSPNAGSGLTTVARAALDAGAQALTLVNTLIGMAIDPATARPRLGNLTGGLSGPAMRPVAVRCIHEARAALGAVPIVGVGGVARADHAVELMAAGAHAVQVGTATFFDPRAPMRILRSLERWCGRHGIPAAAALTGAAHTPADPSARY